MRLPCSTRSDCSLFGLIRLNRRDNCTVPYDESLLTYSPCMVRYGTIRSCTSAVLYRTHYRTITSGK